MHCTVDDFNSIPPPCAHSPMKVLTFLEPGGMKGILAFLCTSFVFVSEKFVEVVNFGVHRNCSSQKAICASVLRISLRFLYEMISFCLKNLTCANFVKTESFQLCSGSHIFCSVVTRKAILLFLLCVVK